MAEVVFRDTVLPPLQGQLEELQVIAHERDGGCRCDWQ
eukprot:COSAG02_NODE_28984_length_578_cov_0.858038_1_plen_37_part_10